jgi:hypothetical protein
MRIAMIFLFLISVVFLAATAPAVASSPAAVVTANVTGAALGVLDLPKVDVDVDVHKSSHAWYKNPVVIGLGVVIVVLLVALAGRGGGGTTIIERRG